MESRSTFPRNSDLDGFRFCQLDFHYSNHLQFPCQFASHPLHPKTALPAKVLRHKAAFFGILGNLTRFASPVRPVLGPLPSRGIRRCALSVGIRSRHARVAAAHAHRMPCRVLGFPQNSAHRLCFTRMPPHAPSAHRSGGGDAVSRDARNAPRHFGAYTGRCTARRTSGA